ncbi:hypothetical protein I302_102559 [Kwoniella bestiolae CBS 10118]|uniref:Uncharacterized protein n=1 Tax=Kwoniella bestiolae CBS 10118 TaxID=1296100 RepID=A0A1B9GFA9_9TREE|nr:hypothetical protein I302_01245 [Kwoniella bestiolae CBS 10118]OCF29732.1 hypothetical protein I302_01245 [Kwoniella bestiolae CBS 10118]
MAQIPTQTTLNNVLRTPPPTLYRPQDDQPPPADDPEPEPTSTDEASQIEEMETVTVTITPVTTVYPDEQQETETITKSYKLTPATTPIPLADKMGLIMPNPWSHLYTGLNYSFGFVDPVPRPAPTAGGWLRVVQPLLVFPNYTVAVFPSIGTEDPTSVDAVPVGSDGLCGATAENYAVAWPFIFLQHGWYMFVVNQTYMQVNVTSNNQCTFPILQQESFFATQTFSIGSAPTYSPGPVAPSSGYTVFAEVSTHTPSDLPIDPHHASRGEKLAIALGVTGAILGIAIIIAVMWFIRKKRKMERESLAFSRLSQKDQEAFLRDNPNSFLNPNHPRYTAKNGGYGNTGPPAPPGTMAYAIWWSQQMWNNQMANFHNPQMAQYSVAPQMVQSQNGLMGQPNMMYGGGGMLHPGYGSAGGMYQYGR